MRFVDDLYALYKNQLSGDENKAVVLVLNILGEQNKDDLLKLVNEMSGDEMKQMLGLYMVELLKARMVKEGIIEPDRDVQNTTYH